MPLRTLLLPLVFLMGLAMQVSAQLDLPRHPRPRSAPKRGLELPPAARDRSLLEEAFGSSSEPAATGAASAAAQEQSEGRGGGLDLPRFGVPGAPSEAPLGPAQVLFEELIRGSQKPAKQKELFRQLTAEGAAALELARQQLSASSARRVLLAGRLLLAAGAAPERELVRGHLRGRALPSVGTQLLRDLAERDPLLVNPDFLMELMAHPESAMRACAADLAAQRVDESWLALLVATRSAESSNVRLYAVELASKLKSAAARRLLLDALGDGRPAIALLAAESLAAWPQPDTVELLRQVAFGELDWDRQAGYALLALVCRELDQGVVLLTDSDLPRLLVGLKSSSELVAGAAAAALAGLGFRGAEALDAACLGQAVPDTLVRLCTGYVFHKDLEALQRIGLPRLALISGEPRSTSSSAWQAWWARHSEDFRPRRSALTPLPNDELNLSITLTIGSPGEQRGFTLLGPGIASAKPGDASQTLFLSHQEALSLMALIQEQGLFDATCRPGRYGALGRGQRSLRLGIRAGEKHFEVGQAVHLPWFESLAERLFELQERLRWQAWYDPALYASSFEFYEAEGPWWEQVDPSESQVRLKQMMLDRLAGWALDERGRGIVELRDYTQRHGLLERSDFAALLGLLSAENDYGTRFSSAAVSPARELTAMLMQAAVGADGRLVAELAEVLFDHLSSAFGSDARVDLERLLELSGDELLLRAAGAREAHRRLVSARPLGLSIKRNGAQPAPQAPLHQDLLLKLIDDQDASVAVAAMDAVGELMLQDCKPKLLLRARDLPENPAALRAAALRALGHLGGAGVRELCMLALGDDAAVLVQAAVQGLASLRDPKNLALLSSLFARGPESGFFDAAAEGLCLLGSRAHAELLPLALTGAGQVGRQASLLLAQGCVAQAASPLLMLLTQDPSDARVAEELAILSAVDYRASEDPVAAWWRWWDGVVHDDPEAWLLAAMAREGLPLPAQAAQLGQQASIRLEVLLGWAHVKKPNLRERLRRELAVLLEQDVAPIPAEPEAYLAWEAGLRRAGLLELGD